MMKKVFLLAIFFACQFQLLAQTGKYAGAMKKLIGKSYTDSRKIKDLSGWQFREGSVITPIHNVEMITVDVFQKGPTYVVFFSVNEDTATNKYLILDAIEIKNVLKSQQIKTAVCRDNLEENVEIVGVVKPGKTEFSKVIKAWRFSRDKRRVEIKSIKNVDCLNEGFDAT